MVDLATGLAAAGQFASGIGQLFSGGGSGPGLREQYNEHLNFLGRLLPRQARWMSEGARAAGLHPLTVVGMNPASGFQAQAFGDTSDTGAAISNMGQGIARAAQAYSSKEERALTQASAQLQLENQSLQNERLRSEIALMRQPGTTPGFTMNQVMPGQNVLPGEMLVPKQKHASSGGMEVGIRPGNQEFYMPGFGPITMKSKDLQDVSEENHLFNLVHDLFVTLPSAWNTANKNNVHSIKSSLYDLLNRDDAVGHKFRELLKLIF